MASLPRRPKRSRRERDEEDGASRTERLPNPSTTDRYNSYGQDIIMLRNFFQSFPLFNYSTMRVSDCPSWKTVQGHLIAQKDNEVTAKAFINNIKNTLMDEPSDDPERLKVEFSRNRYLQMYQIFKFFMNEDPEDTRVWDLYMLAIQAGRTMKHSFMSGPMFLVYKGGRKKKDDNSSGVILPSGFEKVLALYFGFHTMHLARQAKQALEQSGISRKRRRRRASASTDVNPTLANIPSNRRSCGHIYTCVCIVLRSWAKVLALYGFGDIDEFMKHYIKFDHVKLELSIQPSNQFTAFRFTKWTESSVTSNEIPELLSSCTPENLIGLRTVAMHVLTDLEKIIMNTDFYKQNDPRVHPELAKFISEDGQPGPRFSELPDSLLSQIVSLKDSVVPSDLAPAPDPSAFSRDDESASRGASLTGTATPHATRTEHPPSSAQGHTTVPVPAPGSMEDDSHSSTSSSTSSSEKIRRNAASKSKVSGASTAVPELDSRVTSAAIRDTTFQRLPMRTGAVQTKYVPSPKHAQVLLDIKHVEGNRNSPEFKAARDHLMQKMRPFFRTHNCSFEEIVTMDAGLVPDSVLISGGADLNFTDLPFNLRRTQDKNNSNYDSISRSEMKQYSETTAEILRPGGVSLTYCSSEQHHMHTSNFSNQTVMHSENADRRVNAFVVQPFPTIVLQVEGHDGRMPNKQGLYTNIIAPLHMAIRTDDGQAPPKQTFKAGGFVPSSYKPYVNVVNNVRRLEPGEQVRVPSLAEGVSTMALRAEQKPLPEVKEFVSRHSSANDTVVDLTFGTNTTGLACVTLPENRYYIGSELDEQAFEVGTERMLQAFAERLITDGFTFDTEDAKCTDKDREMAILYLSHLEPVVESQKSTLWRPPTGLPNFTTIPMHVLTLISTLERIEGVRRYRASPVDMWDDAMVGALSSTPTDVLLGTDLGYCGLEIRGSRIRHHDAGVGVFAARSFIQGECVTCVPGTLVYHNLTVRVEMTKLYGTGPMGVNVKDFRSLHFPIKVDGDDFVNDAGESVTLVYLVPAKFSVVHFFNDPRYCTEDEEKEKEGTEEGHEANVRVHIRKENVPVKDKSKLCSHTVVEIHAMKDIRAGEEMYLEYPDSVRVE